MTNAEFGNKKIDPKKMKAFGFVRKRNTFTYATDIVNSQFQLTVTITEGGAVDARVIDSASKEEYVLHRTSGAVGSFVSSVRKEYDDIMEEIAAKCFETDVFKSDDARNVIQYVRNTYQDKVEFLWQRFPGNGVFRRKDSGKWYAALLIVSKRKLGLNSDEVINILDLKVDSKDIASVVDGKKYFPGYHMNKKHWITICLDGSVPIDEIFHRIDASYDLAEK